MITRKPVADLAPGDLLIADSRQEHGSRVVEILPVKPGSTLVGPRGGRYDVRLAGDLLIVVLANGARPVLSARRVVQVHVEDVW